MIAPGAGVRVYLACGRTDMRKGMDGLALLIQQGFGEDPFNGAIFAFRGRKAHRTTFCIQFTLCPNSLPVAPTV